MMSAAEVTKMSVPETMAAKMAATATVMAPAMTATMPASVTTTAMAATASRQRRPSQQRCNRNHGNSSNRFQHRNLPQSVTSEPSEIDGNGNRH
jgi:hypothetical protein